MHLPTYQDLTPEQDAVMMLPLKGRWLVTGPPGSGKTVMALYRAKTAAGEELEPVLLMYNRILAHYSRQAVTDLGFDGVVSTFHSWWWRFIRKHWKRRPPADGWVYDWDAIIKLYTDRPIRPAANVVLIDEAQDLPPVFFLFAGLLFERLTVFADENQRINDENSTLQELRENLRPGGERRLTTNHRNTREVAEVAAHFYAGAETGIPDLPDRRGPRPRSVAHGSTNAAIDHIANVSTTSRHLQIGVFVPTKQLVDLYVSGLGARGIAVSGYHSDLDIELLDFSRPGVVVTTWASAKGLEFDTVFVAEMQAWRGKELDSVALRMNLYVLSSRARRVLTFSWTGHGTPSIAALLPPSCLPVPT